MMAILSEYKRRSEEHTSELQLRVDISYAVFCLKKKYSHIHRRRRYSSSDDATMTMARVFASLVGDNRCRLRVRCLRTHFFLNKPPAANITPLSQPAAPPI